MSFAFALAAPPDTDRIRRWQRPFRKRDGILWAFANQNQSAGLMMVLSEAIDRVSGPISRCHHRPERICKVVYGGA